MFNLMLWKQKVTFSFGMLIKDQFYFPKDPHNYIRTTILLNQFTINTVAACYLV